MIIRLRCHVNIYFCMKLNVIDKTDIHVICPNFLVKYLAVFLNSKSNFEGIFRTKYILQEMTKYISFECTSQLKINSDTKFKLEGPFLKT